jgi:hypothetical protein
MATWERIALRAEAQVKVLEEKVKKLTERNEPISLFNPYTYAYYKGEKVYILKLHTYCVYCDRFLDSCTYTIKTTKGEVLHCISEKELYTTLIEWANRERDTPYG